MIDVLLWCAFGIAAHVLAYDKFPLWGRLIAQIAGPIGFIIAMCLLRSVPGWAVLASFVLMCWGLTP